MRSPVSSCSMPPRHKSQGLVKSSERDLEPERIVVFSLFLHFTFV